MAQTCFLKDMLSFLSAEDAEACDLEIDEEKFYELGYHFYSSEDYAHAARTFTRLVLSYPFEERHWRGLASSKQMLREYREAVHAWSLVALLKENDPSPHFHAAECLFSLNQKDDALKALTIAENLLTEQNSPLKDKITLLKGVHSS